MITLEYLIDSGLAPDEAEIFLEAWKIEDEE